MSQQYAQVAKKAKDNWPVSAVVWQQDQDSDHPSVLALVGLYLRSSVQFWFPHGKRDIEVSEKGTELGKESKSFEEEVRSLGAFSLEKKRVR